VLLGILDLGINNLNSVRRAFSSPLRITDAIVIVGNGDSERRPDLLILPGLGKFGAGMMALHERGLIEKIRNWTSEGSKLVGICLGMQMLGTCSEESPGVEGLNLINSRIERLPVGQGERVPHTGWAETSIANKSEYFTTLNSENDFYFVHSYHLVPEDEKNVLTRTPFGTKSFVSSVATKNVLGFQFHPEKSGDKGKDLVSEVIAWTRNEN
jgi:imidazole glycerol phosphate synthase glutamine amidotransferase subunit